MSSPGQNVEASRCPKGSCGAAAEIGEKAGSESVFKARLNSLLKASTHHLHCVMHSAPVAALAALLEWAVRRTFWLPLPGWWPHIVIDVFTRSADYYAVPLLYPFTERGLDGLDGIAWVTPWFMVLNCPALALAGTWLRLRRRRSDGR